MRCPSCGASCGKSDRCSECGAAAVSTTEPHPEECETGNSDPNTEITASQEPGKKSSVLVDFPGVVRSSVPEWRKELTERVREVQERRAREAAQEAAEAEQRRMASAAAQPPSLELLPQGSTPAINPLVAAALRRIERAHERAPSAEVPAVRQTAKALAATAIGHTPDNGSKSQPASLSAAPPPQAEQHKLARDERASQLEKAHNLVVVQTPASTTYAKSGLNKKPKRIISDDDPALNYLNSVPTTTLRVEEISKRRAAVLPRLAGALVDLFVAALLWSPFAALIELTQGNWHGFRTTAFAIITGSLITFLYLTTTIALTGRTVGMRMLSLRVVDRRTGLIPTGGQSAGRAVIYLASLFTLGLATIYGLLNRDGYAPHDRLTGTVVVRV